MNTLWQNSLFITLEIYQVERPYLSLLSSLKPEMKRHGIQVGDALAMPFAVILKN